MCTAAQYSEVEGVILDLNSSYWGGWVEPMVLRVKSHNILTKLPGVASGVLRLMLGLGMIGKSCECGAQSEGCWVRSQGGLYIAMELDSFLPW